jgi:hypothetical protein
MVATESERRFACPVQHARGPVQLRFQAIHCQKLPFGTIGRYLVSSAVMQTDLSRKHRN